MIERKFMRLRSFDERSRNFPIRSRVRGLAAVSNLWTFEKEPLDQGDEGSCVGHGCAHELIAEPVPCVKVDHDYARKIYLQAQKEDEWPGEDYEGTSVLAGVGVLKNWGWCDEFRWSFSHEDTQLGVGYEGPGIAGTDWLSGMMEVDSKGFIHATGANEGGHCYLFLGVDVEEEFFWILNSWGKWGIDGSGRAKLSFSDYEKLRGNFGEMAFLIGRHNVESPEPPEPDEPNNAAKAIAWTGNQLVRVLCRKSEIVAKLKGGG